MANTAKLKLGGQEYQLSPLTFYWLQELQHELSALSPELEGFEYYEKLVDIYSRLLSEEHPDLTPERIKRICLATEISGLLTTFSELMTISGLSLGETEAAAEASTSTLSSPILPSEEFAEATGTASSEQ